MIKILTALVLTSLYASISFAQTMGFGSMGGSFAVNDYGAATYTIPLDIPQGINGMQPNIALVYNSQSGNGVCGIGFSLVASSSIAPTSQDIYHDGVAKGIKYDTNDAYALDGVRLIRMGQYQYCPENAPFDNVSKNSDGFVVKYQNGNTAYYGQTSDSRAIAGGKTYAWYLNKIEDSYGNTMTYSYTADNNYLYLSKITYGTNSKASSGLTNTVTFIYEDRSDVEPFYIKGTKCIMKKRLCSIEMRTNGTLRNTYTLKYNNTNYYTKLTNVTEQYGSTLLPPITFSWDNSSQEFSAKKVSYAPSFFDALSFDINGDGLSDIVKVSSNSVSLYYAQQSNGNISFSSSKSINVNSSNLSKTASAAADVNGDGVADLILVSNNSASETINNCSSGVYTFNVGKDKMLFDAGEFYNNGKSGLLYLKEKASGTTQCKLLQYNSQNQAQILSAQLTLPTNTQTIKTADFDGDGMIDLLVVGSSGYTIFWNNGVSSTTFPFSDSNKTSGSSFSANNIQEYGDFNGDGLLDILLFDNSASKEIGFGSVKLSYKFIIAANNGNGSFSKSNAYTYNTVIEDGLISYTELPTLCNVIDINNDGKDDLLLEVLTKEKPTSSKSGLSAKSAGYNRLWLISSGQNFTDNKTSLSSYSVGDVLYSDFDGDGSEELLANCSDLLVGGGEIDLGDDYCYYKTASTQSNRLLSITEATNGCQVQISYSTLCDKNVYTKGANSAYPLVSITTPLCVVSSVKEIVAGNTYTSNYKYEGLRLHMQGLGCLGFTSVEANNITTGVKRKSTINSLHSTYFEPTRVTTVTTQGGKSSSVETTISFVGKTSKSYFSYPSTIKNTDIYGDVVTTYNTYNTTYGYPTKQRTEYGSSSMYKQTEYQSYIKAGGAYRPQTILFTQKHADASDTFTRKTTYTYNTTTGAVSQSVENASTKPINHTYSYDTFGNVLTHTTSADGVPTVTATNTYDATHRFVASQKSSANQVTATYTYNNLGRLIESSSGVSGAMLKTTYTYDAIGNIATITHPDATKTTYTRGWGSSAKKRHYVTTSTTGLAPVTKWFDNAGREVESSTKGEKNIAISSQKTYNNTLGTLANATSSIGNLSASTSYTYNDLGLPTKVASSNGRTVTFSYARRQSTTTLVGQGTTTQTFDAWGGVKTSSVNQSTKCTFTYASNGNPTSVEYSDANGQSNTKTTMSYDALGRQTQLTDPDAGTIKYEYDALGRIVKQTDARGNVTTNTYNASGLLTKQTCGTFTTNYTYNASLQLTQESAGNQSIQYSYDNLKRLSQKIYSVDGTRLPFIYAYNSKGQIISKTLPDGVAESFAYDDNGNIVTISINGTKVWELSSYSGKQRTIAMGALTATKSFSDQGRLIATSMQKQGSILHSMSYTYDNATGNMTSRAGMTTSKETFTYDAYDRLTAATTNGQTRSISYALNGNISSKTGVGAYTYNKNRPHAVAQVTNVDKLIKQTALDVKYNAFNKAYKITQGAITLDITYGLNRQRCKTVYSDGKNTSTTLYAGSYERRTENGTTRGYNYIYSPDGDLVAICVSERGTNTIYHVETDHLGSIVRAYDTAGNTVFSAEYDAWGKQTISKSTLNLRRGYCQHEHWNEFDLIDMNGRMYDPVVGRFLSPDPYVQDMTNPQNFNRYSYCLNNPLKYTDPSGMQLVIDNGAMPYNEFNDGIRKHAPTVPIHTRRRSNGGYGYGSYGYSSYGYNASAASYGINGTYNFLNSLEGSRSGYVFYDPSKIYDYISSGMSFKDWMNEQIKKANVFYMEDLICLLPEVTAIAHDRASQKRAAQEIWVKGHSTAFYSEDGSDIPTARDGNHGIATSRDGGGSGSNQASTVLAGTGFGMTIMGLGVGDAPSAKYAVGKISAARLTEVGASLGKVAPKVIGGLGFAATSIAAAYEFSTGQENYHTYVDVGVAAGALILTFICPGAALAIGLCTFGYGICSANGVVDDVVEWIKGHPYKRDEDY